MTEQEWLEGSDHRLMMLFAEKLLSDRKTRCFSAALASRLEIGTPAEPDQLAEYAENRTLDLEFHQIQGLHDRILKKAMYCPAHFWAVEGWTQYFAEQARLRPAACAILRDLLEPFQKCVFDPDLLGWNEGVLSKIAATIYNDHAFEQMPVLADALEDAGCDSADILTHCRQPGEHVRGCWLLDTLLGKA